MKQLFLLPVCMLLLLFSCSKEKFEDVIVTPKALIGVTANNGIVKFNTEEDFSNAVTYLKTHQDELSIFDESFEGFMSSTKAFRALQENEFEDYGRFPNLVTTVEINGENYVEKQVDFVIPSYFVNADGLLQIGSDVYKFTYDNIYKTPLENLELLENNNFDESKVSVDPIYRNDNNRVDIDQCDSPWYSYKKGCLFCVRHDYKVSGEISGISTWLYSELRLNTKHRYKVGPVWLYSAVANWGWVAMDSRGGVFIQNFIHLNDGTKVKAPRVHFSFEHAESANGEAEVHHVIDNIPFSSSEFGVDWIIHDVEAHCLDSVTRGCTAEL